MKVAREELFSGAGFSKDQHPDPALGDAPGLSVDPAHFRVESRWSGKLRSCRYGDASGRVTGSHRNGGPDESGRRPNQRRETLCIVGMKESDLQLSAFSGVQGNHCSSVVSIATGFEDQSVGAAGHLDPCTRKASMDGCSHRLGYGDPVVAARNSVHELREVAKREGFQDSRTDGRWWQAGAVVSWLGIRGDRDGHIEVLLLHVLELCPDAAELEQATLGDRYGAFDDSSIHSGSVARAEILESDALVGDDQQGVPARNRRVGDLDGALPTRADGVLARFEREPVGSSAECHQQPVGHVRTPSGRNADREYQLLGSQVQLQKMRFQTAVSLGSGGMGEVFKAWDKDLERFVALKILRQEDPEMVARLQREARLQAHVDHPGVCKVYEVGEDDGHPFIAMEYVDGPLLSEAAPDLGLEQKLLVMLKVAEAVQAAHAAGLIHRDLKPSNIILGNGSDGELRPFVLDFGLAREQEVAGLTVTGQVMGTPGYLSPEQAMGEVSSLDRRTDIFSLGVILYELVTGALPFSGDSATEILLKLLQQEPRQLRKLAPQVPVDVETVVMKCLEKRPDNRYASARELADDLGRILAGEPVTARPIGRVRRIGRLAARRKALTAVVTLSTVAVATAGLVALHTTLEGRRTVLAAQRYGQEVERIERILTRAYFAPLHDLRPEMTEVREHMRRITEEMERRGGLARAIGHAALGRGYLELGEPEMARKQLETAVEAGYDEAEVVVALGLALGRLYREELERIHTLGSRDLREARSRRAQAELRAPAVRLLSSARSGARHPEYVTATLAFFEGDSDTALAALEKSRQTEPWYYMAELLAGDIHAARYRDRAGAGDLKAAESSFEQARSAFTKATEIGRSDPRGYEGLCVLWADALRDSFYGGHGDLESVFQTALAGCRQAEAANPDRAMPHYIMGRTHRYWADQLVVQRKDPVESLGAARGHLERALELDPEDPGPYVVMGVTYRLEANWRAANGDDPTQYLEQALGWYGRAVKIDPRYTSAHLSRALAELHLGQRVRQSGGDPEEHFQAAVTASRRTVELEPQMVGGYVNLGIAYGQLAISRREGGGEAAPLFDRGIAALQRAIELNPEFYTAHFNLAELLVERAELARIEGEDPTQLVA